MLILVFGCTLFISVVNTNDYLFTTIKVEVKQHLIQNGPYKYIRHPMYLSMWLFAFFQGFLLSNIFIEIFGILAWSNLYFIRINNEEKIMIDIFGNEYKEYIENTGRIFPKLRL